MVNKYPKNHTKLICDIGELSGLFHDSNSLEVFLQKIVEMIANHMHCDVCSIYLYYENRQELLLKATIGLNNNFISSISLKLGEGLTGLALKELRPICERQASTNPNFRYFPGLGEEKFESFLAVPIHRGTHMIGAMVIQNTQKNYFTDDDISVFKAITSQLANTIEVTRMIMMVEEKNKSHTKKKTDLSDLKFIKGKSGAQGYAYAKAVVYSSHVDFKKILLSERNHRYTLDDFHSAVKKTEQQLQNFQNHVEEQLSDVASLIFTAQMLMLKDNAFIEMITDKIQSGMNPPDAVCFTTEHYVNRFKQLPDAYLQEKSHDVKDIGQRILENLIGQNDQIIHYEDNIVIAEELLPSEIVKLSSQNVKGVILLSGGVTSHVSILARSLEIPVVIVDSNELMHVAKDALIFMDADIGNIYINPSEQILETFREKEQATLRLAQLKKQISPQTRTDDGHYVRLLANINLLSDVDNAIDYKAEGIGLYRTEFPFIVRNNFPSEQEQFVIYQKVIEKMRKKEVTFRTLDIGGDKVLSYFDHHLKEKNPYLGMRSIRFSLKNKDVFVQQIRAILRAGYQSDIKIMFPMISSIDEFIESKEIVDQCVRDLKKEKVKCQTTPKIGLMIELPSVLEIIDELAQLADFFSIGTNDFIQYMLAVDRTNEKVADLYLPEHPSILRALKKVVSAGKKYNIDVSVCGDMAHDERFMAYLIGIGITTLSLNPKFIPKIQQTIHQLTLKEARSIADNILKQSHIKGMKTYFKNHV
ncbi:MAG: phosphoenolpyruvate--protein phosphotransferase [Candidatus Omnitrophica bacterium]|nr:phosphoenolpyruvate--protein phosphotransferase [Candidatus Omnitrophota bacterium]